MSTVNPSQNFISHLLELRTRLLRAVVAMLIAFVCLFPFRDRLYTALAHPLLERLPKGGHMIATEVTTPFFVPVKVALMTAFLVTLPYILYQLWAFVAPGLYAHEKRLAAPLVIASTALFLCGMSFAYFAVFPVVFGFVTRTVPTGVAVMTDISKYLNFVMSLFVAFGITFEVPIAVILLVKMGLVSIAKLKEIRPYVIVGAFVTGAILTPPDMVSQTLLAVPLWLLYEAGILAAGLIGKPAKTDSDYEPLSDEDMDRQLDAAEAGERKDG